MEDGFLPTTSKQLNLNVVLANGQSFRWKKTSGKSPGFVGVARHCVWKVWRNNDERIEYAIITKFPEQKSGEMGRVLHDYFQLDVDVEELYRSWTEKDDHFRKQMCANPDLLQGIRILKQDLVETLFAFICSANNNISRISGLVEKLCQYYGTKSVAIGEESGEEIEFYDFPSLAQLRQALPGMESKLRDSGFGYRAKYIANTVEKLCGELGGDQWLHSLHAMSYADAKSELMQLPGVGPKVADCICLMGLQKNHVVPVDTHVFQITVELYVDNVSALKNQKGKKTLCKGMHEKIGDFYADRFGIYAGWAHSVLFSNRLRHFKVKSPIEKRRKKN